MNQKEKDWFKYFNYAMKGDVKRLSNELNVPEELAKEISKKIFDERNALRRDMMFFGLWSSPLINKNSEIESKIAEKEKNTRFWGKKQWLESKSKRHPSYCVGDWNSLYAYDIPESFTESSFFTLLHSILPENSDLQYPKVSIGDEVEIRIKDHFYEKERGILIEFDKKGYLIEIHSKAPLKDPKMAKEIRGKIRLKRHEFMKIKTEEII